MKHSFRSSSGPARRRKPQTDVAGITKGLWENVLGEIDPLEIHTGCETQLHDIIKQGAERMVLENRTSPDDFGMAKHNLVRVVGLMKHSAELLGHPQSLGEDTILAADQALVVLAFRPWPFKFGKAYEQRG